MSMNVNVKILGALLTVTASFIYAGEKTKLMKRRCEACRAFLRLMIECKTNVECFCMPLSNMLEKYRDVFLEKSGFLSVARKKGLRAATDECSEAMCLGEEVKRVITEFAAAFGRGFAKSEAQGCDYYIERLKRIAEKLEAESAEKKKLIYTLSVSCSVMTVLFFI